MTGQHPVEWLLRNAASTALVAAFVRSIERAEKAQTDVHLANVVLELLNDATVKARLANDSRVRASAAVSEQLVNVARTYTKPKFAFELIALMEPAHALAVDCGARVVTPTTFLATCLASDLSGDETSRRTQEALRSAGVTTESLIPIPGESETILRDFQYKSLGFGTDLTAMARSGYWLECPLIGMSTQLRTLAKLLNSGVGSVVLVGEPGVGKSALIHGLAYKIAHRDRQIVPHTMDTWTIVMIQAADVLENTTLHGELERRAKEMLAHFKRNSTVIPFFEEIHRLLDTEDQSTRRIAAAFKPPMASGDFHCLGATSDREYGRFIADDRALDSRFRKIVIPEPDYATVRAILSGSQARLLQGRASALGLTITSDAIEAAIRITTNYQRNDRLPRKALNLLSATVSEKVYKIDLGEPADREMSRSITESDVGRLFSELSGIPVEGLHTAKPEYYRSLAVRLRERVRGQPQAIAAVTSSLSLNASGWSDQRRPRGRFLFIGPPGVGKTELARGLAEELIGDPASLIVLNMGDYAAAGEMAFSKFVGSPAGYVGFRETTTVYSRVLMRPYSVVVLDEIDKCNDLLANPLIAILDGAAEDARGNFVDFSQCVIIMTSNAIETDCGAEDLAHERDGAAFASTGPDPDETVRLALRRQGGIWTAPLIDRIDRVCLFNALGESSLLEILDDMIAARRRTASRPLPLELDDPLVRRAILATAAEDGGYASARRLERCLTRWLSGCGDGLA